MRRLRSLLAASLLAAVVAWLGIKQYMPIWSSLRRALSEEKQVELRKGESLKDFASDLAGKGIISDALRFRIWMRFNGQYNKFKAGLYLFKGEVSPEDIKATIEAGRIYEPITLQFVIPEGFTLRQVVDRLEARGVGTREELKALTRDKSLLAQFGIRGSTLEGFLYPATYSFQTMPTAREVFEKMLQKFFGSLPSQLGENLRYRGTDLYQAVIIASLIERETQVEEERAKVSEVIWNRLRAGEPLGIDAALIYGIEDYQGDIKWEHLKDKKNPYNNRIYKGLPPTPIGAISMASLSAVFSPTQEGYRYYVLSSDGSKRHRFTKTLEEHNIYVKKLIDTLR